MLVQKARNSLCSYHKTVLENSACAIFVGPQLLEHREREGVPPERVRPRLLDPKARVIQQSAERFLSELVAALGMNGLRGCELNADLRGWNTHTLIARAFQVHLDPRLHAIPPGPMAEAAGIEVRTELSVEAI